MAIAHFRRKDSEHIKYMKPKHVKYKRFLYVSALINVISIGYIVLTTFNGN